MTTTFQVSRDIFDRLQIGKTYRFDGRKGKVVAKHEDGAGESATGWSSCVPMVTVSWKE